MEKYQKVYGFDKATFFAKLDKKVFPCSVQCCTYSRCLALCKMDSDLLFF